jgi:hypothetical protein
MIVYARLREIIYVGAQCYLRHMPFEPDIIVTGPEGSEVTFVVEAKMNLRDLDESERQLKKFMFGMGCPVGLLVTPRTLFLYLNQYLPSSEDSIHRMAEFDTDHLLNCGRATRGHPWSRVDEARSS